MNLKMFKSWVPNYIDLIGHLAVWYLMTKQYNYAIGFFAYTIVCTLDQIMWVLNRRNIKDIEKEENEE